MRNNPANLFNPVNHGSDILHPKKVDFLHIPFLLPVVLLQKNSTA
jgi:hypothetical protein